MSFLQWLFDSTQPEPVLEKSPDLPQQLPSEVIAKILTDDHEELKAAILSKGLYQATREIVVRRLLYKPSMRNEVRTECCGNPENDLVTRFSELFSDRRNVGYVVEIQHSPESISTFEDILHMKIIGKSCYDFINTLQEQRFVYNVSIFELEDGGYIYLAKGGISKTSIVSRPYDSSESHIPDVLSLHTIILKRVERFEIANCDPKVVTIEQFRSQLEAFQHPLFKSAYLQMNLIQLDGFMVPWNQNKNRNGQYSDMTAFDSLIPTIEEFTVKVETRFRTM